MITLVSVSRSVSASASICTSLLLIFLLLWSAVITSPLILVLIIVVISWVLWSLVVLILSLFNVIVLESIVLMALTVFELFLYSRWHGVLVCFSMPLSLGVFSGCVRPDDFCLLSLTPSRCSASFTTCWHVTGWSILREFWFVSNAILVFFFVDCLLSCLANIVVNWLASPTTTSTTTPSTPGLLSIIFWVLDRVIWLFLWLVSLLWLLILPFLILSGFILLFWIRLRLFSVLLLWFVGHNFF